MRISEKERLTELYYCLKAVPLELWESQDYDIVKSALEEKNLSFEQCLFFHIFGKLAHFQTLPEEFVKSIKTDNIPSLILTEEESRQLQWGTKKAAKAISKGSIGTASDSLKIFQYYYARAA
ncbi:MAG: hypothetical protein CME65_13060 [Halobacteriovoraceae bacterium]|nr:hypothetical protein [Halobacteriovoraceae bacterium]|tara:strand:- start:5581 stop:5946 length:366 start_codon:yes stop_codon:yes gene_type:complete